jgi:hypothetical protein
MRRSVLVLKTPPIMPLDKGTHIQEKGIMFFVLEMISEAAIADNIVNFGDTNRSGNLP